MKHQIELRLPKIFGKKKKTEESKPEVTTKVFVEEELNELPKSVLIGGLLVVGVTAGYLVGFKNGVSKGGNTYIFRE